MFGSVFSGGVVHRAIERGCVEVFVHNLRDFCRDKHRQVDDRPFGGRQGMVLKPEPIFAAVVKVRQDDSSPVVLLSPQGKRFDFRLAESLAQQVQVILICGRYEGVDERVVQHLVTEEVSIGDFILTGGEPAAWVIVDAVSRFIPRVVGKPESMREDSFLEGMLDYPLYTRPREFQGLKVPALLFSGDHAKIARWRRKKSLEKTSLMRPDLLEERELSQEDEEILDEIREERKKR